MPEIKQVNAILSNPGPNDPVGRVTVGHYVVEGGLVTLVDSDGKPLRRRAGDRYTHKLQPGENPDAVACRMTLLAYHAAQGDMANFNRPIHISNQHWS